MALETPGKLRDFFLLLCGHPVLYYRVASIVVKYCMTRLVIMG